MMQTIKIESFEYKTSKTGNKYYSFKTDQGSMSCFEDPVNAELVKYGGQSVSVDVQTRPNGFKNITGFHNVVTGTPEVTTSVINESPKAVPQEVNVSSEPKEMCYRINIKQNARGFSYYEVTVKADDIEKLKADLKVVKDFAKTECAAANALLEMKEKKEDVISP